MDSHPLVPRQAAIRRAGALLLSLWLLFLGCLALPAVAAETVPETSVKAAFVYKFLGYVEWPDESAGPLTIGVIGSDELAAELAAVTRERSVGSRPVAVRRVRPGDSLAGLQALFVASSERARQAALLRPVLERPVLTVTETEDGLSSGSIINFRHIDGHVRFEVSLENAERSNIKLSSRLLAVAFQVQRGPQ